MRRARRRVRAGRRKSVIARFGVSSAPVVGVVDLGARVERKCGIARFAGRLRQSRTR
jgi:hypothetical protein